MGPMSKRKVTIAIDTLDLSCCRALIKLINLSSRATSSLNTDIGGCIMRVRRSLKHCDGDDNSPDTDNRHNNNDHRDY